MSDGMTRDRKLAVRLARLIVRDPPGCNCETDYECILCTAKRILGSDMPKEPLCSWCKRRTATHVDWSPELNSTVCTTRCCGDDGCCLATPGAGPAIVREPIFGH